MHAPLDQARFQVRPWGYVFPALPQLLLAAWCTIWLVRDPSMWVGWCLLLCSGGLAGVRLLALRDALRVRWLITIDPGGVRWNDTGAYLSWPEVAEIRVVVTSGWRRALPHLPDRVVFVTPAEAEFAARARSRPLGRPIFLHRVKAAPKSIVDAAQRFTDANVRYH